MPRIKYLGIFKNTLLYTAGSVVFQFAIGFCSLCFQHEVQACPVSQGIDDGELAHPADGYGAFIQVYDGFKRRSVQSAAPIMGNDRHPDPLAVRPEYGHLVRYHRQHLGRHSFNMLLISAGLSSLPEDVYESASLDGANAFRNSSI
ncbi:hypothetical protein PO124_21420 [Bacillus licheniformis]|nr:hypothetical protein [Bacillus licheniformis]